MLIVAVARCATLNRQKEGFYDSNVRSTDGYFLVRREGQEIWGQRRLQWTLGSGCAGFGRKRIFLRARWKNELDCCAVIFLASRTATQYRPSRRWRKWRRLLKCRFMSLCMTVRNRPLVMAMRSTLRTGVMPGRMLGL